jgi:hypothetical protein
MITKNKCLKEIKAFRAKQGLEAPEENIIACIHLMNAHGTDAHRALDQSSRSSHDHGIDAWYYDEKNCQLYIYQSKLTESKQAVLKGLNDLVVASEWLENVIVYGKLEHVPNDNHCLFNLYTTLGKVRGNIEKIEFSLLSLFDKNELEDAPECDEFEKALIKSKLNEYFHKERNGKLTSRLLQYNLESVIPEGIKTYPISKIANARIDLRKKAHLDLAYVPLFSLIELYQQRGTILFDKNVRLSLAGAKEARERLVHPMEDTLEKITSGELNPNIFPFYHIGVTIAASASIAESDDLLTLEAPSIINGCQTITISNEYFKRLEKRDDPERIKRFKQIKVIAKVVVGTTDEELKEITNANNRQNPIDNWQLFSNEPIHIEIEYTLKDIGIFYERQKGKFDTVMKTAENAKYYFNTNGTFVKVVDLGQVIALCKRMMQWAAKPSDIFLNKQNHSKVFDRSIPKYPRDIVFCANLFKAIKRGLQVYLELPVHVNSNAGKLFQKPLVRAYISRLALLYFYQHPKKDDIRTDYSKALLKIASPALVDEMQIFYQKVITRTKNWYNSESQQLTVDVSQKSLDSFFEKLETEIGVDSADGSIPFSNNSIDWNSYESE